MPPKDVNETVKSLQEKGDKHAAQRQNAEAVNMYSQAIGQSPSAALYLKRGKCYSILSKSDKAIKDFTSVIGLDSLNVEAFKLRGAIYERIQKFEEAMRDYFTVRGLTRNASGQEEYTNMIVKVADMKAKKIIKTRGRRWPSRFHLDTIRSVYRGKQWPADRPEDEETGDGQFALAEYFIGQREYQQAFDSYDKAVRLNTTHMANALSMRGLLNYMCGLIDKGLADLAQAISIDANCLEAYLNRSMIQIENEDARKIMIDFGAAISLDPKNATIYFLRGQNYLFSGNPQIALRDFQKASELDPNYEKAHAHLANAIADMGEVKRALTMLKDLTEKFPNSWFIYNTYAKILCLNRQYEEAIKAYDKAISIAPEQAMLYLNKAQIVDQWQRDFKGAERLCLQALAVDPRVELAMITIGTMAAERRDMAKAVIWCDKALDSIMRLGQMTTILLTREDANEHVVFDKKYPGRLGLTYSIRST
ncbi:TOM (translocase of outer membrane) complex component [Podila clonocystis]|nr:TOM (translocase of outer membrane) complex component [Podila clonocystis]